MIAVRCFRGQVPENWGALNPWAGWMLRGTCASPGMPSICITVSSNSKYRAKDLNLWVVVAVTAALIVTPVETAVHNSPPELSI